MEIATRCPLCAGPTDCGVALGKGICWCFSTPVSPDVLARVPEDQRNLVCVCQNCEESADPRPGSESSSDL